MLGIQFKWRDVVSAACLTLGTFGGVLPTALAQTPAATEWGWPQPYEKVSDKSIVWLKQKGWWPMTVAFQPPWSGQNTVNIVMDRQGLMTQRGVEAKWQAFPSGPAINEVMVSARAQADGSWRMSSSSRAPRRWRPIS